MLVGIPTSEAQVKTAHECSATIDQAELLVMGPVENHLVGCAIHALQVILVHVSQARGVQCQVLEGALNLRRHHMAIGKVVGMTEDCDIGMQGLQGVLGVGGR